MNKKKTIKPLELFNNEIWSISSDKAFYFVINLKQNRRFLIFYDFNFEHKKDILAENFPKYIVQILKKVRINNDPFKI